MYIYTLCQSVIGTVISNDLNFGASEATTYPLRVDNDSQMIYISYIYI